MSNRTIVVILLTGLMMISCYKPYTTGIDNDEKIMVVDGLITNRAASYHIKLNYASQFYSPGGTEPISNARVSVTDNKGAEIFFRETVDGDYVSDASIFTAKPGDSYVLRIETVEGDVYESTPQKMETEYEPDSVYAINDYQEYISRFNQVLRKLTGARILLNIEGKKAELPGFRIDVELYKLYTYSLNIPPPGFDPPLYIFYCWQLDKTMKEVILASPSGKSTNSIENQSIYFVDNLTYLEGVAYDLGPDHPENTPMAYPTADRKIYTLSGRVMYIDLYALNDDAFTYYQKIEDQITAEGKLFDPISVRMEGNIKCISDPGKTAFGFFEVSSLNHTSYKVGLKNPSTDQVPVKKIPCMIPDSPDGSRVDEKPPFWIF